MDTSSVHEKQPVVLSRREWEEIGDCVVALYEAIKGCRQAYDSARTIHSRLDRHINRVSNRLAGLGKDEETSPMG